jgi:hypothetical protein
MAQKNDLPLLALSTESLSTPPDEDGPKLPKDPPSYPLRQPGMNFLIQITNGGDGYSYNMQGIKYEKPYLTFEEGRYMWETNCIFSAVGPRPGEQTPPTRVDPPGSVSIRSAWDKTIYTEQATGNTVLGDSFFRVLHRTTSMFIQRASYEELVALSRESDPLMFIARGDSGQNIGAPPTASGSYNRFWKIYTPYFQDGDAVLQSKYTAGVANATNRARVESVLYLVEMLYFQRAPAASPRSIRTPRLGVRTTKQHALENVRQRKGELMIGRSRSGTTGRMQNRPVLELLKKDAIDASWEEAWLTIWASLHDLSPIVFCCSYNFGFPIYIMEAGVNFDDLVKSNTLDQSSYVDLGASLLALIQKGAGKGLVMADCKPPNLTVVMRGDGKLQVRYIDFGSDFATLVRVEGSNYIDDSGGAYSGVVSSKCAELLTLVVFCAGVYSHNIHSTSMGIVYRLCADRLRILHETMGDLGKPDGMPYTLCGLLNEITYTNATNYVQSQDQYGRGWRMFVKTNAEDVASTILAMAKYYGGITERDLADGGRIDEIVDSSKLQKDQPLLPQIVNAIQQKTQNKEQKPQNKEVLQFL